MFHLQEIPKKSAASKSNFEKPEKSLSPGILAEKTTFCAARVHHEFYAINVICLGHHPNLHAIVIDDGTVQVVTIGVLESIVTWQQANPNFQVSF